MPPALSITADWERLEEGTPEERACFAALAICCHGQSLTEGHDGFVSRIRPGPLVSAYHLAEWLAWNWWRLRWEPRSSAPDWAFAHRLTTIGAGYVWPNVTIFSDGERTTLTARPTAPRPASAFRYISDLAAIVPSPLFEGEVDRFVGQVLGQLQAESVRDTNLERLWSELGEERHDRETARRRKLEALLGQEPDAADPARIDALLTDARELGERAVEELAANNASGTAPPTAADLRQMAASNGFDAEASGRTRLGLPPRQLPSPRDVPAWQLGAEAARLLRAQAGLAEDAVIADARLAELVGVAAAALGSSERRGPDLSFSLDTSATRSRVVLRSRWHTGRRFELARLLADRIVTSQGGRLHPATRAYTYRQKMQRSFAAELLSPFSAVDAMLNGDYSAEAQADAAEYFQVSDRTILTLLVNHHRVEREELDEDLGAAA